MTSWVLMQTFLLKIYLHSKIIHINLKDIIRAKALVILYGHKDCSVTVMNWTDYNKIMQKMIHDGIKNKIYEEAIDNTLKALKFFQEFLYSNFNNYENYDDTRPVSNQPAILYGTTITHRVLRLGDIKLLKLLNYLHINLPK